MAGTMKTLLKTLTKLLWTWLTLNAFLMGNPGNPSVPIAQAWTTDLNGARPEQTLAVSNLQAASFPIHFFPFPSFPFLSLPFPSFPFLSLPFPSFPFLSLPFPSFPFLSLALTPAHHSLNQLDLPRRYTSLKRALTVVDCMFWLLHLIEAVTSSIIEDGLQKLNWHSYTVQWAVTMPEEPNKENSKPAKKSKTRRNATGSDLNLHQSPKTTCIFLFFSLQRLMALARSSTSAKLEEKIWLSPGR